MKTKQAFYSTNLSNIAFQRKRVNLKINTNIIFAKEKDKYKSKINSIYSKVAKPKINTAHTFYSKLLSQSNLKYKKLNQKKLKEENEKYLKRIFSHEKLYASTNRTPKKIILPSIIKKCSSTKKEDANDIKKIFINKPMIKLVNSKKVNIKVINLTKIQKEETKDKKNEIYNEIIIKSLEEKKIEEENKKKEEKEIKEEIEKKEKLKKELNEEKYQEQKKLLEIKEKNKLKNNQNKKDLEKFKKEQEIINKKNIKDKNSILNADISNIKNKDTKYKILKELELLIKHGVQFNLENQTQLSLEVNKLMSEYDNESFELILNIINSMISSESDFNSSLLKNIIKIIYENKNIKDDTYKKALNLIVLLNEKIGIIDETEDLFWNNLTNKKYFLICLKGIHFLLKNCYGLNEETKIDKLIDIFFKYYESSDDEIKNILCSIIQNISLIYNFKDRVFNSILHILDKIDIKNEPNYIVFSKILEQISSSKQFNNNLIIDNQKIFEKLIASGKINEHLFNLIKSLENKTNSATINEFIQFNKNLNDGKNINAIKSYLENNNQILSNMDYLLPYIEKNLDKQYFLNILYELGNKNKSLYKKLNVSYLLDNMNNDLETTLKIIDDGVLYMNKNEIENLFIPKFEAIIFDNERSEEEKNKLFNLILKFIGVNKDLILTEGLKNLYEIYNSEIITKKTVELIDSLILSKSYFPSFIIEKILNTKFDSSCESRIYNLIEIIINEDCQMLKRKLGNNFENLCLKILDDKDINIPKIIKNLISNNINLQEEIYKLLGDKLNKRLELCFKEKKERNSKFMLVCLMRYFKFDKLDDTFQNYLTVNINKICNYDDKNNSLEEKFIIKTLYNLFIYYVLENDESFSKYKKLLFESISNSEVINEYKNINNYQEFISKFKNFDFLEEVLIFSLALNFLIEIQENYNEIKENIKNLKEKKIEQKTINDILYLINELADNYLISNDEAKIFLNKYIFDYNFKDFDDIKKNKLKIFQKIKKNWIEKNIEKIGIINNKKYLLDFVIENNYSGDVIEKILKSLDFKGNDDEIQLKKVINIVQNNRFEDFSIFSFIFGEIESYEDLFDELYYQISFTMIYNKKKDTNSFTNFIDLSKILLSIDWSLKEIEELFDKNINFEKISPDDFNEMIEFIKNNHITYSKLNNNHENLIDILSSYPQKDWEYQLKKLLVSDLKAYDFSSLINEIYKLNSDNYTKDEMDEIVDIIVKIKQKKFMNLPGINILIKDIEINDIQNYFSSNYFQDFIQKARTSRDLFIEFLIEIMAIVNRAVKIFTQGEKRLNEGYELRDVQLLSIVLILLSPKNKGVFAQIKTGQGKSIIIAVLAVFKSLFVKYVDILTSSIELASRDSKELEPFYKIFNLTVDCAKNENPYVYNIVYTDTLDFESEIIFEKFHESGKRLKNKNRGFKCLIIDEVDSICVDRLNESTCLIFNPRGFASLQNIYPYLYYMFNSLMYALFNNYYGDITKIEKEIKFLREKFAKGVKLFLENNNIRIPNHLKSFVINQISNYAISLQLALLAKEKDVQYKIMDNEIKVVDNLNTGVVYKNMHWHDGQDQFLQIKHGIPITLEEMTTTYLCHYNYYMLYHNNKDNNYETNIIGVTGTIGSESTKNLLKKLFEVKIIIIPPFCPSKFIRLNNKFGFRTEEDWRNAIINETIENTSKNRPVLIITNSGKELSKLNNLLIKKWNKNLVYTYEVNERDKLKSAYSPGEILVGTNLAGRGTDLKLLDNVENFGGLHVIITFLPINLRVEEQGFGRTARKGLSGSGRLIIKEYKPRSVLESEREEKEKKILKYTEDNIIKNLLLKAELFDKVCEIVHQIRAKGYDKYVLDDLQHQWGLFYKYYLEDDWMEFSVERRNQIINLFNKFKHKLLNNIENNIFSNPLNSIMTKKYDQALKDDEILCFYFYQYKANFNDDNYIDKKNDLKRFIEIINNNIIPELYSIGAISNISHKRKFLYLDFFKSNNNYSKFLKEEEFYSDGLTLNIAKKINFFSKIIEITLENINVINENTRFTNKFIDIKEFIEKGDIDNIGYYLESFAIRSIYIYEGNNKKIDLKKMDNNIIVLLKISEFIGTIASKYSIENNFNTSNMTLEDIIYGFNLFLENRFKDLYSKIASLLYIAIESIDRYFSEDFEIKNKDNKSKLTLKEIYKEKKSKFDKISGYKVLSFENVDLLNNLY